MHTLSLIDCHSGSATVQARYAAYNQCVLQMERLAPHTQAYQVILTTLCFRLRSILNAMQDDPDWFDRTAPLYVLLEQGQTVRALKDSISPHIMFADTIETLEKAYIMCGESLQVIRAFLPAQSPEDQAIGQDAPPSNQLPPEMDHLMTGMERCLRRVSQSSCSIV